MGTAIHEYFEKYLKIWADKYNYTDYQFEKQVESTFIVDDVPLKVSGRFDVMDGTEMWDIKTAKAWKKIFDPDLEDWHAQQNMYAYLCHLNGIAVDSINIMAVYKDWQENNALRDPKYPQDQIVDYNLNYWNFQDTEEYIWDRLRKHHAVEETPDDELPACTRKERWERFNGGHDVEYAIMKSPQAKRAAKVVRTTLSDAYAIANGMKGITSQSFIEVRYARRTRCHDWCPVANKCNHYQAYKKKYDTGKLNDFLPIK
jgi:hypothetical protein